MADTAVAITAGSGTNIDTRTESTNGNHRQVVVLGDPASNTAVAAVKDASTLPLTSDTALVVTERDKLPAGQNTMVNVPCFSIASDQSWPVSTVGFMKKEDVPSADGDAGIPAMAVRKATPADSSGTDGDWEFLQVKNGRLWGSVQAYGDIAHDAVDASPPQKGGHKATTSVAGLTLVSSGDVTDSFAGVDGVQIVRPHCNLEDIVTAVVTCTAGANTLGIAAQGAGVKFYLTSVIIRNAGTSNGNLLVTDGSGGTTKADIPFPASTGTVYNPPVPIPFSANTAVFVDPSGSDNIIVTLVGFKSKI